MEYFATGYVSSRSYETTDELRVTAPFGSACWVADGSKSSCFYGRIFELINFLDSRYGKY